MKSVFFSYMKGKRKMKDNPNTEKFIEIWKKNFKQEMGTCPECGGFNIYVCEKALRKMLNAQLNRMDKEIYLAKTNL